MRTKYQIIIARLEEVEKNLIAVLEREKNSNKPTISVSVVDQDGAYVMHDVSYGFTTTLYRVRKYKDISLQEAFKALQDMCDIEVTYEVTAGTKETAKVVIYEKTQ